MLDKTPLAAHLATDKQYGYVLRHFQASGKQVDCIELTVSMVPLGTVSFYGAIVVAVPIR